MSSAGPIPPDPRAWTEVDQLALELMAIVRTEIDGETVTPTHILTEAVREYLAIRKVSGEPGSWSIVVSDAPARSSVEDPSDILWREYAARMRGERS